MPSKEWWDKLGPEPAQAGAAAPVASGDAFGDLAASVLAEPAAEQASVAATPTPEPGWLDTLLSGAQEVAGRGFGGLTRGLEGPERTSEGRGDLLDRFASMVPGALPFATAARVGMSLAGAPNDEAPSRTAGALGLMPPLPPAIMPLLSDPIMGALSKSPLVGAERALNRTGFGGLDALTHLLDPSAQAEDTLAGLGFENVPQRQTEPMAVDFARQHGLSDKAGLGIDTLLQLGLPLLGGFAMERGAAGKAAKAKLATEATAAESAAKLAAEEVAGVPTKATYDDLVKQRAVDLRAAKDAAAAPKRLGLTADDMRPETDVVKEGLEKTGAELDALNRQVAERDAAAEAQWRAVNFERQAHETEVAMRRAAEVRQFEVDVDTRAGDFARADRPDLELPGGGIMYGGAPAPEPGQLALPAPRQPAALLPEAPSILQAAHDAITPKAETVAAESAGLTAAADAEAQPSILQLAREALRPGTIIPKFRGGLQDVTSLFDPSAYQWSSDARAVATREHLKKAGANGAVAAADLLEKGGIPRDTASAMARSLFPPASGAIGPGAPPNAAKGQPRALADAEAVAANLIREAIPSRKAQEAGYTAERKGRAETIGRIARDTTMSPEERLKAMGAALGGELPKETFAPTRDLLTPEQRNQLFENVLQSPRLKPYESYKAAGALDRLLDPKYTLPPTVGEIKLITKAMPQLGADLAKKFHANERVETLLSKVIGVPRELVAGPDISLAFRQGMWFVGTKEWRGAFSKYISAALSEDVARSVSNELRARPNWDLYEKYGLGVAELAEKGDIHGLQDLVNRPEGFQSGLAEHIPLAGRFYRGSSRGGQTFLNVLRADTFDHWLEDMRSSGQMPDEKGMQRMAQGINIFSAKGELGKLSMHTPLLGSVFFSPSMLAARLETIPIALMPGMPRYVRMQLARRLAVTSAAGLGIMGLAAYNGFKTSTSLTDSDGWKIRDGDTRIDLWGGHGQLLRQVATQALGYHKDEDGVYKRLGSDFKKRSRADEAAHFARSKLAPLPAALVDAMVGKTFVGDPVDWKSVSSELLIPMVLRDTAEAVGAHGATFKSLLYSGMSAAGVGVSTYKRGGIAAGLTDRGFEVGWQGIAGDVKNAVANGELTGAQGARIKKDLERVEMFTKLRSLDANDRKMTIANLPPDQQARYAPFLELDVLRGQERELEARKDIGGLLTSFQLRQLQQTKGRIRVLSLRLASDNRAK